MRKRPISSEVGFHFLRPATLRNRNGIRKVLLQMGQKYGNEQFNLHYIFCSDSYLLKINRKYLGHDEFTDIVTFDLSSLPRQIEGEIYISIDRVRENARELSVPFSQELSRVIFHGALHLCGFNDKTNNEISNMRAAEEKWLRVLNKRVFHVKQKRKRRST